MLESNQLWEQSIDDDFEIIDHKDLNKKFRSIKIERDDNYRLVCQLRGELEKGEYIAHESGRAGEIIKQTEIVVAQKYSKTINIKGLFISETSLGDLIELRASGEISEIEQFYLPREQMGKPVYINYWLTNSNKNLNYTRVSSIEKYRKVIIETGGLTKEIIDRQEGSSITHNIIMLNVNKKRILFGYVNERFTNGRKGSFIKTIEGNFFEESEIKNIVNALSLLMGQRYELIGYTKYNSVNSPISMKYISTHRDDMKKIESLHPMPIIPINEENLSFLVNKYIEYNNVFKLNLITSYVKVSQELPLDLEIQPLATAFDILQRYWFKSDKSKSKGKNLNDETYKEIIGNYIDNISKSLEDVKNKDAIINKIRNSNFMSENQKRNVFFEELSLTVGEVEKQSMKERNKIIHGQSGSKRDPQRSDDINRAFYSILVKTILKIIGYDNQFIDYSTRGFPMRNMSDELGGPSNDRTI